MRETKFKHTEIGDIPADWEMIKFGDALTFLPNNTFSRDALCDKGKIKNIHYGDVLIKYGSTLDVKNTEIPAINPSKFPNYKPKFIAKDGDVIIADTAEDETVCKSTELWNIEDTQVVSGLHTMWCRPQSNMFSIKFLGYYINSAIFHNQILPLIQGIKVSSVSKTAIKDTFICVPPLAEQKHIAEVLSDVDALISSFDKLIAKKQAIKQGAMQRLLTGKKRLKGFSEPWVEKKIDEIAEVGRGRVISNQEIQKASNQKYPVYSSQTIAKGILGYIDTYDFDGEYITWTTDGVNAGTVFYRSGKFNCTNVCGVLSVKNYDTRFIALRLSLETSQYVSTNLANPKLMNGVMKSIVISIPSTLEEQRAIATILTDLDDDIALLQRKKSKYEVLKQGMMQQLLTGRIRLSDSGENSIESPNFKTGNERSTSATTIIQPKSPYSGWEDNAPAEAAEKHGKCTANEEKQG